MPLTTSGWPKDGPTRVTSTYAVSPPKATSIAPPMPTSGIARGRPLAKVVTAPVFGSTRRTRPPGPSVTYSAPSGPIVLPEPQPPVQPGAANVASSRTTGHVAGFAALAIEVVTAAVTAAAVASIRARRTNRRDRRPSLDGDVPVLRSVPRLARRMACSFIGSPFRLRGADRTACLAERASVKPPYFMAAYAVQEMTLDLSPPDRGRSDTAAAVREYGGSTDVLPEGGA